MITDLKDCKKHVGVGGWHCNCCAPHDKQKARRHIRRKSKQRVNKEINQELFDNQD